MKTIKEKIEGMTIEELLDYQQHLQMLAKMEDRFLLSTQLETDKQVHREMHSYNYDLQDFTHEVLKTKQSNMSE
jgi:hypothetical protein